MTAGRNRVKTSLPNDQIIAFPLSGRTSDIRRCAGELENIHGQAAVLYWRTACAELAGSLSGLGCTTAEISAQVMAFQTEVQIELMRRYSERLDTALRAEA